MILSMRASFVLGFALTLPAMTLATQAQSQSRLPPPRPVHAPQSIAPVPTAAPSTPVAAAAPTAATAPAASAPHGLAAEITLADVGFANGLRFSNLGGRHDIFVPLPEGDGLTASELVLVLDDVSAHDARRNLEVQVNDRTAAAIALDGNSRGRTIRVPLGKIKPKAGYLKFSFLYSGAATLDRCIDVRAVGDTLTVNPETAVDIDLGQRRHARRCHDGRVNAA